MTFAYDIMVCIRNIIKTASNIMNMAQNTMTFVYDIMVCIRNIISTASNIMMKTQDTVTFAYDIMACENNTNIDCIQYNDQSTGYNDVYL